MDQQTQHHLEFVRNAGCGHTPDLLNLKFSQVPSGLVCTLPSETHWSATLVKPAKETSQFTVFINRLQRIIKWNQTIPFALWITEYYFFQISAPAFFPAIEIEAAVHLVYLGDARSGQSGQPRAAVAQLRQQLFRPPVTTVDRTLPGNPGCSSFLLHSSIRAHSN